jgi:hypothetical protein
MDPKPSLLRRFEFRGGESQRAATCEGAKLLWRHTLALQIAAAFGAVRHRQV